jgi:hypothetical protein
VRVLPEAAGRSFDELGRHLRDALGSAQRASQRGTRRGTSEERPAGGRRRNG